jgi:serine/threonine protein kinase
VIYEVGETEDVRPYIAMEYVAGQSLAQRIAEGTLELARVVDVAAQVADALDAAHARHIVHRDLKPSNIILNERSQAKVLDFGLAKRLPIGANDPYAETGLLETQSGTLLGTPNYMSPEQARAQSVDHRTDIFSLGVVMYEMITGRSPFAGASLGDTIGKILNSQPPALARFNYEAPVELERIVLKCLQKDPDRRYQTASDLRVDLVNLKAQLEGGKTTDVANVPLHADDDGGKPATRPSLADVSDSDIFISCSQIDDQPLSPAKKGWISQFQHNLRVRLEQLSGERVRICSLPMPLGKPPSDGDSLMRTLPNVKTMVSVISPPFVRSEGCWRGVEQFWEAASQAGRLHVGDRPRLFKVVKTPVDLNELPMRVQDLLQRLIAFEFYERDPESGRVREYDETFGEAARQRYYERVYDLAYEIAESLKNARRTSGGHSGCRTTSNAPRRIYLAETTTDLHSARDRIRRELLEQGHTVWPDRPLPLVAGDLERTIAGYLEQSELAIHLIGERYGLVPEDSQESLASLQNRLAAERSKSAGLTRLIWMPRRVQPRDERQAAFLREITESPEAQHGADVIEDTLENLKEALESRLAPVAKPSPPRPSTTAPRLYLVCDVRDETALEQVEDYFYEQGVEVSLPEFEGDESTVAEVHQRNLQDCDAALIYYGDGGKAWVDIKLRELIKATGYRDGRRIELQAVYVAPPFDRRKERFKTLSAEVFRQIGDQFDSSVLDSLTQRLKALRQDR